MLQTPVAVVSLIVAMLGLKWPVLRIVSVVALVVSGTALWMRLSQGRRWEDKTVVATVAIGTAACLVLIGSLAWGAARSGPSVAASSSTPAATAASSPPAPPPASAAASAVLSATATSPAPPTAPPTTTPPTLAVTGSWVAYDSPLTVRVTRVELDSDGHLRLNVTVANSGSQTYSLPLFGNCQLTDNSQETLQADASASSTEVLSAPGGQTIYGTIAFDGPVAASATKFNLSFNEVEGLFNGGLTISGIPIPH